MKITANTKLLSIALAQLKPIAKPSTSAAILSNVLFEARSGALKLTATDLEKQLSITIPCHIEREGETTISCVRMHDSVANLKDADLSIETNDKHESTVKCGDGYKAKRPGLPPEEMPPAIIAEDGIAVTVPVSTFNDLMAKSLLFAATDPTKAHLLSVCIVSRNGMMNFQATNQQRAIICETEIPFVSDLQYFIPRESVASMVKLASEGDLAVILSDNIATARTENAEFSTKLLEGKLSDLAKIIPQGIEEKVTVSREGMLGLLKQVAPDLSVNSMIISVECTGSKLSISASDTTKKDGHASQVWMSAKKGSYKASFSINHAFLGDALKCLSGDEVTIECADKMIVLREIGVTCCISLMQPA